LSTRTGALLAAPLLFVPFSVPRRPRSQFPQPIPRVRLTPSSVPAAAGSRSTRRRTPPAPVPVGGKPQQLRIQPGGARLWVPNQGSGTVSVVDACRPTARIRTGRDVAPRRPRIFHTFPLSTRRSSERGRPPGHHGRQKPLHRLPFSIRQLVAADHALHHPVPQDPLKTDTSHSGQLDVP
jgi:hypothetical protein